MLPGALVQFHQDRKEFNDTQQKKRRTVLGFIVILKNIFSIQCFEHIYNVNVHIRFSYLYKLFSSIYKTLYYPKYLLYTLHTIYTVSFFFIDFFFLKNLFQIVQFIHVESLLMHSNIYILKNVIQLQERKFVRSFFFRGMHRYAKLYLI